MPIRLIQEEDLDVCSEIYTEAFSARPYTGVWKKDEALEMLSGLLDRDPFSCWCTERDDEIAGFIFCTQFGGFRATIQEFAIKPRFQKLGLGTALMKYALDEFRSRGVQTTDLVVNEDAPAYKLYRRLGFMQPVHYTVLTRWL